MTDKEFARNVWDSVNVLSAFIKKGSAAILEPQDKCTVDDIYLNAVIGVCIQLITSVFKKEESDNVLIPEPLLDEILAEIKNRILEASSGVIHVKVPKDK